VNIMKPLVSILIPAFNSAEWIAATIQSAVLQSWPNKEIIVVDDGSVDRTYEIARKFESNRVLVTRQTNQGAASARNKAFSLCSGEFIQWLDADDLLDPRKIAVQLEALKTTDSKKTLLSSAWGRFYYCTQKARFTETSLWTTLSPIDWLVRCYSNSHWMANSSWLVNRELTTTVGPWNTRLSLDDDGEYFCRVVLASDIIKFVPQAKVFCRRSLGSLSYVGSCSRKMDSQFLSMKLQFGHVRAREDSERIRLACLAYLKQVILYFFPDRPDLVAEVQKLAVQIGGEIEQPDLPLKYYLLKALFGVRIANRLRLAYNRNKISARMWLEKNLLVNYPRTCSKNEVHKEDLK